ncbi:MAG: T9SS type A sorting domain-containing protein [Saprospiraceae bacterium]|nr:T9SS type A sorting domain-containing protein [Saprospiraceae bacterium]
MKKIFSILPLLALCTFMFSQDPLPRGFAEGEMEKMRDYLTQAQSRSFACEELPENATFRTMAEWEELDALVITWAAHSQILTEIVRAAQEEVTVIIVTNNPSSVQTTLSNAGVNPDLNIEYVQRNYDSIWVRDYGPNTVYQDGIGERAIVDWIYNRPRPLDDTVPEAVADLMGDPMYCTTTAPEDLVHTGGNFMSDGMGRAFSSELVLEENGPDNNWGTSNHSNEEIDSIMSKYMGIESYPKLDNLPWDVIHHIDMHMKLLDEETLLVGEYPEGIADGPQIEANIQFILSNFIAPSGNPYRVIRVPMPPDADGNYPEYPGNQWWLAGDYRTYANAVFVNKTILVPTYEEQYDTTGLRIWEEAMPGYNIVGINSNAIIPSLGAIHCITKEVGTSEPLLVNHLRPRTLCHDENNRLEVSADHISGIDKVNLHFRLQGELEFTMQEMEFDLSAGKYFSEFSTGGADGSNLEYYFEAIANDGKSINRPLPAPVGYFSVPLEQCAPTSASEEISVAGEMKVFPNPAAEITFIEIDLSENFEGRLVLLDIMGKEIRTIKQGEFSPGMQKHFFDAATIPAGIYIVQLQKNQQTIRSQKLAIK